MKKGFRESGLKINRYLAKLNEWTEDEIKKRAEKLSEVALKIWGDLSGTIHTDNSGHTATLRYAQASLRLASYVRKTLGEMTAINRRSQKNAN